MQAFIFEECSAGNPHATFCEGRPREQWGRLLDKPAILILLKAIQEFDGTVMLVGHDRHILRSIASRVFEVDHGELRVYEGNYVYYTAQKQASLK